LIRGEEKGVPYAPTKPTGGRTISCCGGGKKRKRKKRTFFDGEKRRET